MNKQSPAPRTLNWVERNIMNTSLIILVALTAIFVGASIAYMVYMANHAMDGIEEYDDFPIEW